MIARFPSSMHVWRMAGRQARGSCSLRLPTTKHRTHIIILLRLLVYKAHAILLATDAGSPGMLARSTGAIWLSSLYTALLASAAIQQPVRRGSTAAAARLVGLEHRVVHHAGGRACGQQVLERVAAVVRLARPQVDRPRPVAPQRQVADRQRGRRVVAAGAAAADRGAEQVVRLPGGVVRGRGRCVPCPPARRAPFKVS